MSDDFRPAMFAYKAMNDPETGELVDCMVPWARHRKLCAAQFHAGEDYALTVFEGAEDRSRRALFAALRNVFKNLREEYEARFPDQESLRKWALVQIGHCTETDFAFDTPKDARTFAIAMRKADRYAVIVLTGNIVKVAVAKSIKRSALPTKDAFNEVKNKFLDFIAPMANTTRREVEKESEAEAKPTRRFA